MIRFECLSPLGQDEPAIVPVHSRSRHDQQGLAQPLETLGDADLDALTFAVRILGRSRCGRRSRQAVAVEHAILDSLARQT